jgi:RNA polymerase sigma-70 factor (ECF subfamily)
LSPFRGSFGDALLTCHDSVYRYARALCHDPVEAEELVQETYRRALSARHKPAKRNLESLRPWMFTILRNHWHNQMRQRRRILPEAEGELSSPETPERIVYRRFLQSEVRDALDALPALYREVIVLREMESLSYSEIAGILGCPSGTVMSRLSRARHHLRHLLAKFAPAAKGAAHS